MRTHERGELGAMVVRRHEQIALVLVRRIAGRLGGGRQALEVELVRVALAVHLGHDILVVVVSACGGKQLKRVIPERIFLNIWFFN